jgi:hypothetical protein
MIDDMALLKQAMEQMDAEDPTAAQAAKDRAAQILSDAKLNFSKMAELIEQRQLLLRPESWPASNAWISPACSETRHSATQAARSGEKVRAFVKLPKQSNLPPDPRSDTRIWRRRASPAVRNGEGAAVRNGERAGSARVAESARFCRELCFLSAATSHPVPRDRTPRHVAVLWLAWLHSLRPASLGIFRWRCRRPRQRG